jgi:hypothetical protein
MAVLEHAGESTFCHSESVNEFGDGFFWVWDTFAGVEGSTDFLAVCFGDKAGVDDNFVCAGGVSVADNIPNEVFELRVWMVALPAVGWGFFHDF